jgi:hypothetical protein
MKWQEAVEDYKEFRNLYASPNIIRAIKSRRMRCTGYVERTGYIRNAYKF